MQPLHIRVVALTLSLLMPCILANHHYAAFALDDLALFANGLYAGSNLHGVFLLKTLNRHGLRLAAPSDPASSQVVRGKLHRNLVARQNSNEVHAQLPRYMG